MASFTKFTRPEHPRSGTVTERDLDIIEAILRYRFSPTSELSRLVGGHEDVNLRRLRKLWEWGYINRFAFPGIRRHSEFIYYLDTTTTLELLVQHRRADEIHPQMEEEIRLNREAAYAEAVIRGQHMKLGFLQHSLTISRMHFMLEMASRNRTNGTSIVRWSQGAELRGHKVEVPDMRSRRLDGSNEYVWDEHDVKTVRLPVEPDALFSLGFTDRAEPVHFCYEADRGTMPLSDMLRKLRAYYHFVKRQQLHKQAFGLHPIRSVLIETTDEPRALKLMELTKHYGVIGEAKRSNLFWFCISPLFASKDAAGPAIYLDRPEVVLDQLWATPDASLHSLRDSENTLGRAIGS